MATRNQLPVRLVSGVAITVALYAGVCSGRVLAQGLGQMRLEALQAQLKEAVAHGAGAEEQGKLWFRMARLYENRLETPQTLDAYERTIRLLEHTPAQSDYANALHSLGAVYLWSGRLAEADGCLRKSMDTFQKLGDRTSVAEVKVAMTLELLLQRKFRKAAEEISAAIEVLESAENRDLGELSTAYLARGQALCGMGKCDRALEDVGRARATLGNKVASNSLELIGIWTNEGTDELRVGRLEDGTRSMREALRLVRSRTDFPQAMSAKLQLGILQQFSLALKDADQNQQARQVDAEVDAIQSTMPATCKNCTVSVTALGFAPGR